MKALIERFDNKRVLIDAHINNIVNYPSMSLENAKNLLDLLDNVNKNIRSLKLLDFEKNNFSNALLINIILKLDKNTRIQFELTVDSQDIPTFHNLLQFMEKRSHMLDSINRNVQIKAS